MDAIQFLNQHRVVRVEIDPKGYGDGLSDVWRCDCGEEFAYDGVDEFHAHLVTDASRISSPSV